MQYKQTKKAYEEILEVMNKNKDICLYDIRDFKQKSKYHLFGIELQEKYGLNIEPEDIRSLEYINFNDYISIGWWGEKYNRTIGWENNGKQPEDELLLVLGFSTGAYIFGADYPKEFFQKFFLELQSYNPKYTDTANKDLYFSMDNASKIFNEFPAILKRYSEENQQDFKKRKIEKLKKELEELKK